MGHHYKYIYNITYLDVADFLLKRGQIRNLLVLRELSMLSQKFKQIFSIFHKKELLENMIL